MPIEEEVNLFDLAPYRGRYGKPAINLFDIQPLPIHESKASFGKLIGAHIQNNTPIGAFFASGEGRTGLPDAGPWNPEVELGLGTENDLTHALGIPKNIVYKLLTTSNRSEFDAILYRFRNEVENHRTMGQYGFFTNLAAGLIAAPFDPIMYIPAGHFFAKGLRNLGPISGRQFISGVGQSFVKGGSIGLAFGGLSQSIVQPQLQTGSFEQGALNTTFAALFGGGLFAAGKALTSAWKTQFFIDMANDVRGSTAKHGFDETIGFKSVEDLVASAKIYEPPGIEGLSSANSHPAYRNTKTGEIYSPLSEFVEFEATHSSLGSKLRTRKDFNPKDWETGVLGAEDQFIGFGLDPDLNPLFNTVRAGMFEPGMEFTSLGNKWVVDIDQKGILFRNLTDPDVKPWRPFSSDESVLFDVGSVQFRQIRMWNDAGDAATVQMTGPKILGALGAITSPLIRAFRSTSNVVRSVAEKLLPSAVHLAQERLGIPHSLAVKTLANTRRAKYLNTMRITDELFVAAKKNNPMLDSDAFYNEIGTILMGRKKTSPTPEVNTAAGHFRRLYDDFAEAAEQYIPGFKRSEGDFHHRVYLREKVATDQFIDDLVADWKNLGSKTDDALLREAAIETQQAILSTNAPSEALKALKNRGPTKDRSLHVSNDFLMNYTDYHAGYAVQHYVRAMSGDIELARAFGDPTMTAPIADITLDFNLKIQKAKQQGNFKLAEKLKNEADEMLTYIEHFRDDIRGIRNIPGNPSGAYQKGLPRLRILSNLAYAGHFLLANIVDMTHTVAQFGLRRTLKDGWRKLFSFQRAKDWNPTVAEIQRLGEGLEAVTSHILEDLTDVQHATGTVTGVDRTLRKANDKMFKWSLMQKWTDTTQKINAVVAHSTILDAAVSKLKGQSLSKHDANLMLTLGLSDDMLKAIGREFVELGSPTTPKGSRLANAHKWKNASTKEAFRAAISKSGDMFRSLSNIGDRPLWATSNIGRSLTQYMSFAYAAVSRIMISRLQRPDMAALNGTLIALGLGGMIYSTRKWIRTGNWANDPDELAVGAVDSSGLFAMIFSGDTMLSRITAGEVGLHRLYPGFQHRFYQPQDALQAVLGPSGGLAGDVLHGLPSTTIQLMGDGKVDQASVREIRNSIPFGNLFYLDYLFSRLGHPLDVIPIK